MKHFLSPWLIGGFVVAFFAVGLPYWQVPYAKVALPNTLMGPGVIVVAIAAALARTMGRTRFWATVLVIAAAVPCVVMARVTADTATDPTSHNLWPFEVVIASFVGLMASGVGTVLVSVPSFISRFSGGDTSSLHRR
jgi:hypothetical protein